MDNTIQEACKVTLGFFGAYGFNIGVQVYHKFQANIEHSRLKKLGHKEKLDIYNSPTMLASTRSVANFLEWQGPFLALFWMNAIVNKTGISWGWVTVLARIAYPLLACSGGITQAGIKPRMFLATVPAYAVLIYYGVKLYQAL
jgi:hypothetical protein